MRKGLYYVRPTTKEARVELVDYLKKQGFTYAHQANRESKIASPFPIVIEAESKTISHIHRAAIAACTVKVLITEEEFYQNYHS